MISFLKRIINRLVRKSTYIHREPINRASLIILVIIDFFVLFNVFSGLNSISEWPLSPSEEFPCYSAYQNYQTSKDKGTFKFDAATIENLLDNNRSWQRPVVDSSNRLGKVSNLCDNSTRLAKEINIPENRKFKEGIERLKNKIYSLKSENQTLQSQYNSTLLEKIAGQDRKNSINKASAEQTKAKIDDNNKQIADNEKQITEQQTKLIQYPASAAYLKLLNNDSEYQVLDKAYDSAYFWYSTKQLILQSLFLLPLVTIAYLWHSVAIRRDKGLQALLSWHLLLIFCIPLLIKLFEFVQFGTIISAGISVIVSLLGGLLFIASYLYILIIPLIGFGLIKLLQTFVFNPQLQARRRIQNQHCISCNSKLRLSDEFCPYCGFNQYIDCSSCHKKTYKYTNFCSSCGHKVDHN